MYELKWPQRDYVVQVARFDPAKGKKAITFMRCRMTGLACRYSQRD